MSIFSSDHSFDSIGHWLKHLDDQTTGLACHVSNAGEPYVEFIAQALSRPSDVEIIERQVATQFHAQLSSYLDARGGTIYWRIPFEFVIEEAAVVARYDINGPDKDFMTDRACFLDKDWKRIACYCRVYRATMRTPDVVKKAIAA